MRIIKELARKYANESICVLIWIRFGNFMVYKVLVEIKCTWIRCRIVIDISGYYNKFAPR